MEIPQHLFWCDQCDFGEHFDAIIIKIFIHMATAKQSLGQGVVQYHNSYTNPGSRHYYVMSELRVRVFTITATGFALCLAYILDLPMDTS